MPAATRPGVPPTARTRARLWRPARRAGTHGPSSVRTAKSRLRSSRPRTATARTTVEAARAATRTRKVNDMLKEPKTPNRYHDTPRDKPQAERVEHANLERPGAQAHPKFAGFSRV